MQTQPSTPNRKKKNKKGFLIGDPAKPEEEEIPLSKSSCADLANGSLRMFVIYSAGFYAVLMTWSHLP